MGKKVSLYWKCQLSGWSVAALYWGVAGYLQGNFNIILGSGQFVTDVFCYLLLTHLYRNFALRYHWPQLSLPALFKRIIPSVFILGVAYTVVTVVKIYLFRQWFYLGPAVSLSYFLAVNGLDIFMAGLRLMAVWLLAYHLYHYAQREMLIAKENTRLEFLHTEIQLNTLSAQLNPHFLFNSLNNIKSMVTDRPQSARRAIDLLADLLRNTLYTNYAVLTTIEEEILLVKDYLELEKLRLEERLRYDIQVDPAMRKTAIMRLSIQTLVENAIKHGINERKEGGLISIAVVNKLSHVKISVQQPGKLKEGITKGIGLQNLQERIKLQFKGKANLKIFQYQETVISVLRVPVSGAEELCLAVKEELSFTAENQLTENYKSILASTDNQFLQQDRSPSEVNKIKA